VRPCATGSAGRFPPAANADTIDGVVQDRQNRPLVIDVKSGALYVGVGSVGNIEVEP
jgi:hypothetical protein